MLFRYLAAVFVGGLAIEVAASPVRGHPDVGAVARKREIPATHTVHERHMPHWAYTWEQKRKVPAKALLPMRIGLKQANLQDGHELLMDM